MKPIDRRRNEQGFTLIEVAIAISILAVMMVLNYKIIRGMVTTKQVLDDQREGMFIANSVLTRLSRELQLATGSRPLLDSCDSAARTASSSSSGTGSAPAAPRLLMIGEQKNLGSGKGRGDTITFMAREAGQYIPDGGTHSGIVQITYRVESDPDQKDSQQPTYLLVRDELPNKQPVTQACKQAIRFPITNSLVSLEFSYYDQKTNEWVDSWTDQRSFKIPNIIQYRIALRSSSGVIQVYTGAVAPKFKA